MKFVINREDLLNGIRIVERATVIKGLQAVLANILFETVGTNQLKLTATDFDLSITTTLNATVETEGKFTLPAKMLGDIVSRLQDELVTIDINDNSARITCKKSKFDVLGISANEFPHVEENISEEDSIEIEATPFVKAIRQVAPAAAAYETNTLLSGVVCEVNKNILEMAATDGNRLARIKEVVKNNFGDGEKVFEMLISSKVLNELSKIATLTNSENIKISKEEKRVIISVDKTKIITKLMHGQFPKYNQLIPQTFPKEAKINKFNLISTLERVAVLVNDKTSSIKFEFADNMLKLSANAPDTGNATDVLDINYNGEPLTIAFNYKYILEFLKIVAAEEIVIKLNSELAATIFAPCSDEDYIYLVMPVQLRN